MKNCEQFRKKILYVRERCLHCDNEFYKPASSDELFCSPDCWDKVDENDADIVIKHISRKYNHSCILCGSTENVEIHHINKDKTCNTEQNMTLLCEHCIKIVQAGLSATVYKTFIIEVSHNLKGHPTCGDVHGHSMKISIGITGPLDLKTGMVIDFKVLKGILQKVVIDRFDHSYLNETFSIPTAEIIAYYIYVKLSEIGLNVEVVRVHETENNYAEFK